MAGRGVAPSETSLEKGTPRLNPHTFQVLIADGRIRGPELSELKPNQEPWNPATRDWWDVWRASAQSQLFTPTDWTELLFTALLVDTIWNKPSAIAMAELRQRMTRFGAALDDRQRLRMKVGDTQPADNKNGTALVSVAPIDRRKKPENF